MGEITWVAVTPQTLPGGDYFYMGLTELQYRALVQNQAEMLRYVQELEWLLGYYEGTNTEPTPPAK